jgi:hypothetical protein
VNIPRVGQEVIVGFEEGDPDRPLILGCLFNARNMPPYPLPERRDCSGIIQRSHGGVAANSNEIRFENALGKEELLIHAETDMHQHAENDQYVRVGHDYQSLVGNDHHVQVGINHYHDVGHNYILTVGSPFDWKVGKPGGSGPQGSGVGGGGEDNGPSAPTQRDDPLDLNRAAAGLQQLINDISWLFDPTTEETDQIPGVGTIQITAPQLLTIVKLFKWEIDLGLAIQWAVASYQAAMANLQVALVNAQLTGLNAQAAGVNVQAYGSQVNLATGLEVDANFSAKVNVCEGLALNKNAIFILA